MRVDWLTAMAAIIVEPAGLTCRYEPHEGRFVWAFYKGERAVKRISRPESVLEAAEGLLKS